MDEREGLVEKRSTTSVIKTVGQQGVGYDDQGNPDSTPEKLDHRAAFGKTQ